jgi:hypothetical protein
LWSHFWIYFKNFYTKTFKIVYILFVYLFIMFIWVVFICTYFFHFIIFAISMKNLQSVTVLMEIVPFRLFHFSVSPLNSLIFCFLNVLILSVLHQNIQNCLYFVCLFVHYVYMSGFYLYILFPWFKFWGFTVISALQSSVKSIGKCKKKSLHNQPKQFFFWFIYSLCCYEWFLFVNLCNLDTLRIKTFENRKRI